MKLFEYEGKQLFKQYGIPIPTGWLWDDCPPNFSYPVIAKTQVLTGGRGKAGGITPVYNHTDLLKAINRLINLRINGEKVTTLYIESMVDFQKEFYLSIIIDRNEKAPVLLASAAGGMDIEDVPAEQLLKIRTDPLLGLQPYMIRQVAQFLQLELGTVEPLIQNLWQLFQAENATLVEINPLFLLTSGQLLAGDAKVILDDHADQDGHAAILPRTTDGFENVCLELGAVGVELDGDIAVVTSGAGLGMATFDMVSHQNGTVRALVDLGGHVIHDVALANQLVEYIKALHPKALLFNFFFQVASCNVLATAISQGFGGTSIPVVIRLKGKDEGLALQTLAPHANIYTTDQLTAACEMVIQLTRGEQ
jgi:succinyl-CoA synthetase beta subunit